MIHETLLKFEKKGLFIEDVLESYFYGLATKEELNEYKNGKEKINSFWFTIEQQLFQILEGIPLEDFEYILSEIMYIVLDMRIEKIKFAKLKMTRGNHWKKRKEIQRKKIRRRHPKLHGALPLEKPDEILDTSSRVVNPNNVGKLPIGYETENTETLRNIFTKIIFNTREDYGLPKKEKIINDCIAIIYTRI